MFCDTVRCHDAVDWSPIYIMVGAIVALLMTCSTCCGSSATHHDARRTRCCTKPDKDPAAVAPEDAPPDHRLLHGFCSVISLRGVAVMLAQPVVLLWPRLHVAALLLSWMYQILSSLSSVLGLPLPQHAMSVIEFFAPLVNLDITAIPKIGCGLGYYQVLYVRTLSVAVLVGPMWVLWAIRTKIFSRIHIAIAKKRGKGRLMQEHAMQLMRAHTLTEVVVGWTFNVIALAHPSITRTLLQLYDCRTMDDGSSHLVVDVSVSCTTARLSGESGLGPQDPAYSLHSTIGHVALCAWCGLLPLLIVMKLFSARKLLRSGQKHPWCQPFCAHYRPSCYMWDVYSVLARSLLSGGLLLWERGSAVQPAMGAAISTAFMAISACVRPLESGSASSSASASALVDAAKEDVKIAQAMVNATKAALEEHMANDDAKGGRTYRDELTWKQRRIAASILRPHIIPAAGKRQFDRNDCHRTKDDKGGWARAWIPKREWDRNPAILEATAGIKDATKDIQDKLYVVEEINQAFEHQADSFPVQHGVGISFNLLAVCFKRYRRETDDVRDFTQDHLQSFIEESRLRCALKEAIAYQRRCWYQLLKSKRSLNPPGPHGGRLANVALIACVATVCAAYVMCYVLRRLQHSSHPSAPDFLDAAGHVLLVVQIPPVILLSIMAFAPLVQDCRHSNAARLASVHVVTHREEHKQGDDANDDEEGTLSEEVDEDEAADIKRLRHTRSKIEGGAISNDAVGARSVGDESLSTVPADRQARKLEH